jgi:hypothetical protein
MTAIDKNLKITRLHVFIAIFLSLASLIASCKNVSNIDVDIDFTILSKTLIQAEYHRVGMNTGNYVGKTMRMAGRYDPVTSEDGEAVHIIILMDGDECCQIGFEFRLTDGGDYPAIGEMVEITGVLAVSGSGHVYLAVSELEILKEN